MWSEVIKDTTLSLEDESQTLISTSDLAESQTPNSRLPLDSPETPQTEQNRLNTTSPNLP